MNENRNIEQSLATDPLRDVATEHVLRRLNEAVRLARRDLCSNLTRVRELLEETIDQTDAWIISRLHAFASDANRADEVPQQFSRLPVATLAHTGGEPISEFLLIRFGEISIERPGRAGGFVFDRGHAASAKRWFDQLGRKLAIDYEHQSFERFNTRADGLRPAAGWIGGLEIRDDGLWATDVTWTDRARELLRSGEYRYFSPVIYWTDEDYSDVAALGPVALTNDPAMHGVRPLTGAGSEKGDGEEGEGEKGEGEKVKTGAADAEHVFEPAVRDDLEESFQAEQKSFRAQPASFRAQRGIWSPSESDSRAQPEETFAALGRNEAGRADREHASALTTPAHHERAAADNALLLREQLEANERAIELLQQQLATQEADTFVERGMRLGKILDSTSMDWRTDFLRDAGEAAARLERAPVLLPPGRVIKLDARGRVREDAPGRRAFGEHADFYRSWGIDPEDLEAYEQARGAGRIRRFAASEQRNN